MGLTGKERGLIGIVPLDPPTRVGAGHALASGLHTMVTLRWASGPWAGDDGPKEQADNR